jgi:hypothetical protein
MVDISAGGSLPTAAQMQTYYEASQAVWRAQRMREASRAVITGNIALSLCVLGTVLAVIHSPSVGMAGPVIADALILGYLAIAVLSLRWMMRQRSQSLVTVVHRQEENVRRAVARPSRLVTILLAAVVFQVVSIIGWRIAFDHMSNAAILASLSICPFGGIVCFVRRFVAFHLWEDLLFAGCVALAYAPLFLRSWDLTPLCFLSLALVIPGVASLHYRWVEWTRSLADMGNEESFEEVRS